ncbi:kinase-like domain-containing protein [Desarmillaria tabescens]|uniref:Kinase-like domain-containing protein n=1 Tax=Armillaria tabescens TaxID=1929756 RepID=A0AA39TTM6_ARMTA|nr:kinase-like domain-containing protein [Desarmillaria tabescens]KAK0466078.1 kinase-like domain-containing protein [Desarmillaria tabescens]
MSRVVRLRGNEGQGIRIITEGADRKVTPRPAHGEELLSVPIPYGPDFLNVRIGQVIPREDETTFRVDHNDYLSVKILHKLGIGHHASVWLGRSDQWKNENGSQYFAVKVFSIQGSLDVGQHELRRHEIMKRKTGSHPGSRHIALNCWSVVLAEPFSRLVSVMDLCGACLTQLHLLGDQGTKQRWPVNVWQKLFRDMLLALDFLHSGCGLVHGDIKGDDILADNALDDDQLKELLDKEPIEFGESTTFRDNLYNRDFKDTSSVYHKVQQPMQMPLMTQLDPSMSFKLCDFGACHPIYKDSPTSVPTTSLRRRAPELVLGLPWDEKIDIWTLGIIASPITFIFIQDHSHAVQMLETLTYRPVFRGPFDRFQSFTNKKTMEEAEKYNVQDHLFAMTLFSGEDKQFPRWMIEASPKGKEYFSADGKLKSGSWKSVLPEELVQTVQHMTKNVIATEIVGHEILSTQALMVGVDKDLVGIIEQCFTLDPKESPSAKELLQHDFFKRSVNDDGDGDGFIHHLVSRAEGSE